MKLTGQPLDVLSLLVTHADRVVTRDELRRELWGDETFVDFEQGLNTAIARPRHVLGDSAEHPQFVETVPGRGYRFVADVRTPGSPPPPEPVPPPAPRIDRRTWLVGGLGVVFGAAGAWLGLRRPDGPPASGAPRRFAVSVPPAPNLVPSTGFLDVAISPDGHRIAYRASADGAVGLYTLALDSSRGHFLPGVNLSSPFFSFDGAQIGYYAFDTRSIMRLPASGGAPARVMDAPAFLAGASWPEDGSITFATRNSTLGILRVAATGGPPEALTEPASGEHHLMPEVLPGGRALLFAVVPADRSEAPYIALLDLRSRDVRRLLPGSHPRFAASGHLVCLVEDDLLAVRFDPRRLEIDGQPVVVLEGIGATGGVGQYSLSREGTLLVAMRADTTRRALVWVDRNGSEETFPAAARPYTYPRIAPDGRRIATTRESNRGRIFIWDSARAAETPLESVSDASLDLYPVRRDSEHLAYVSGTNPRHELRALAVSGGGPGDPIGSGFTLRAPYFFAASGRELVYAWQGPRDEPKEVALWQTSTARDAEPVRVLGGAQRRPLRIAHRLALLALRGVSSRVRAGFLSREGTQTRTRGGHGNGDADDEASGTDGSILSQED